LLWLGKVRVVVDDQDRQLAVVEGEGKADDGLRESA
jgi:hypothetical protein